ncbi:MAG: type I toxin-antitoxin system SymE family toxin [Clostridiales bacterium]|nr:type I toxin-antitoxin system SymE family toxin [Clostridiales bacterium]
MKTKNIKVQYSNKYQANGGLLPKIQMEGKWLEALGFSVGTHLVVEYEEGSIRIRTLFPKRRRTSSARGSFSWNSKRSSAKSITYGNRETPSRSRW